MSDSFEVTGLKELEKALLDLEAITAKKALREAMMFATKPTLDAMKAAAPIGDGKGKDHKGNPRTPGRLKRSLRRKFYVVRSRKSFVVEIGSMGKYAYYAKFIEYGTAPHYVNRGAKRVNYRGEVINRISGRKHPGNPKKKHPGAKAHPFIRKALIQTADTVLSRLKQRLARNIERAAKTQGRSK